MAASDSHYQKMFQGVLFDPYRIISVYGITHPAHQHALKKLLRCGQSIKDTVTDIDEIMMALTRWKAMLKEEQPPHIDVLA